MPGRRVDTGVATHRPRSAGKIYKVPTTPKEAMKSAMLGMVEKGRMAQFTAWVDSVKLEDRNTWKSKSLTGYTELPLDTMSGADFFKYAAYLPAPPTHPPPTHLARPPITPHPSCMPRPRLIR